MLKYIMSLFCVVKLSPMELRLLKYTAAARMQ